MILCLLTALLLFFPGIPDSEQRTMNVIRPVEIQDVLLNPGMGITTFQRFNGQAINPGTKWSEEGPVAKVADAATDFPETSIAYCRWFWNTLEPAQGKVRWDIIEGALAEARRHRQTLAIRLMPYDQEHPLPQWFRDCGARRANKTSDSDGAIWQPDFSDPLYLKHWGTLIAAAGSRYDGHPTLESVDISSIGYWGEGWSPYMPPFEHQRALTDIYFAAFRRTPLLMNFDEEHGLAYAVERGAGWRLDCWGDMRTQSTDPFFPPEMLDVYPQQIVRAGIQEAWRRSPVSLEACWVPLHWKSQGWDIDYILDQALRWHVSSVNIKSSAIPAEWRQKFNEFQKRMGYRFVLRRMEYPVASRTGRMIPIKMWWFNAGVAPVYRPYTLAFNLVSSQSQAVIHTEADVRRWLPGDSVFESSLYLPHDLKPGTYELHVALLDPVSRQPAIRLAVQGREADGWYKIGNLTIE